MPTQEIIVLTADDKKLLDSLSRINTKIKQIQNEASKTGQAIGSVGGATGSTVSSMSALTGVAGNVAGALKDIALSGLKVAGILGATTIGAIKALTSGFRDLETGLYEVIQMQVNAHFIKTAESAYSAAGGLLEMGKAIDLARRGKGISLENKQIDNISKLAGLYNLMSNGAIGASEATEQLMLAIEKGAAPKALSKVDSALVERIRLITEANSKLSMAEKRTKLLIEVEKALARATEQSGDALNSPFVRLLTTIKKLKEQTQGLGQILGGIAKTAGAVLAPLAGGFAAFAIGGPVLGTLGIIIGGLISAALGAFSIKALQVFGSKDKTATERIGDFFKRFQVGLEFFLLTIFEAGVGFTYKMPKEIFGNLFGGQGDAKSFLKPFISGGDILNNFSKGFMKGFFDENWGNWLDFFAPYINDIKNNVIGGGIKSTIGALKQTTTSESIGLFLGNLAEGLTKTLLILVNALLFLADVIKTTFGIGQKAADLVNPLKYIERQTESVKDAAKYMKDAVKTMKEHLLDIKGTLSAAFPPAPAPGAETGEGGFKYVAGVKGLGGEGGLGESIRELAGGRVVGLLDEIKLELQTHTTILQHIDERPR